jgi:quercetin 2,3-dioxygenase
MLDIRRFQSLGHANHGWLNARHHFSFANYHDPNRMGWGLIRVWNDDEIAAKSGFPPHPHRDMEIITFVRQGAISHQDNQGNRGRTGAGDVQVMSAGSGIVHAEYNLEPEETRIFQIWILPREGGGQPFWNAAEFPRGDRAGQWTAVASGYDDAGALPIRANARVLAATVNTGDAVTHSFVPHHPFAYLTVASGRVAMDGEVLEARDAVAIRDVSSLTVTALEDAELVMVETADLPTRMS